MSPGDKSSHSDKQTREAAHDIEASYEAHGKQPAHDTSDWPSVASSNESGGGKAPEANRERSSMHKESSIERARKGGQLGGQASARRSAAAKSASAKRAAETRKRNAAAR